MSSFTLTDGGDFWALLIWRAAIQERASEQWETRSWRLTIESAGVDVAAEVFRVCHAVHEVRLRCCVLILPIHVRLDHVAVVVGQNRPHL